MVHNNLVVHAHFTHTLQEAASSCTETTQLLATVLDKSRRRDSLWKEHSEALPQLSFCISDVIIP